MGKIIDRIRQRQRQAERKAGARTLPAYGWQHGPSRPPFRVPATEDRLPEMRRQISSLAMTWILAGRLPPDSCTWARDEYGGLTLAPKD